MIVFISSVISGMEEFRDTAEDAVRILRHDVLRSEKFPASPSSPQVACLTGVREANLMVLLLGARYGERQRSGLSATHEEYREARERCPVIVLIQQGVTPEPPQLAFIQEVQEWTKGHSTAHFSDSETLRNAIVRAIHEEELARARGSASPEDLLTRAHTLLPRSAASAQPQLAVVVTGGPRQVVLRPSELEDPLLAQALHQDALFGSHRVLDPREGTDPRLDGHALLLMQERSSVFLNEEGSLRLIIGLDDREARGPAQLPVVIEEDVREAITRALGFADAALQGIDGTQRLTHVAVVAALLGAEYRPWRTREEHARRPSSGEITLHSPSEPVELSPPHCTRAAFRVNVDQIANDLTALLRRQWKGVRR